MGTNVWVGITFKKIMKLILILLNEIFLVKHKIIQVQYFAYSLNLAFAALLFK